MAEGRRRSDTEETPTRRRTQAIRVLTPDVVPMSTDDYEQAVTALATMITAWWQHHRPHPDH